MLPCAMHIIWTFEVIIHSLEPSVSCWVCVLYATAPAAVILILPGAVPSLGRAHQSSSSSQFSGSPPDPSPFPLPLQSLLAPSYGPTNCWLLNVTQNTDPRIVMVYDPRPMARKIKLFSVLSEISMPQFKPLFNVLKISFDDLCQKIQ